MKKSFVGLSVRFCCVFGVWKGVLQQKNERTARLGFEFLCFQKKRFCFFALSVSVVFTSKKVGASDVWTTVFLRKGKRASAVVLSVQTVLARKAYAFVVAAAFFEVAWQPLNFFVALAKRLP